MLREHRKSLYKCFMATLLIKTVDYIVDLIIILDGLKFHPPSNIWIMRKPCMAFLVASLPTHIHSRAPIRKKEYYRKQLILWTHYPNSDLSLLCLNEICSQVKKWRWTTAKGKDGNRKNQASGQQQSQWPSIQGSRSHQLRSKSYIRKPGTE